MPKDFLKYIDRLSKKDKEKFLKIIKDIEILNFEKMDIKKMQGFQKRFRARVGKFRIIFEIVDDIGIIYEINTRGDIY